MKQYIQFLEKNPVEIQGILTKDFFFLNQEYSKSNTNFTAKAINLLILHASIQGNHLLLKELLKKNFNINSIELQSYTPLMLSCIGNHSSCVDLLLRAGANRDAKNTLGESAFDCCLFSDSEDSLLRLFESIPIHEITYFIEDNDLIFKASYSRAIKCLNLFENTIPALIESFELSKSLTEAIKVNTTHSTKRL